jgi:uncharacterized membrane protein (UPF0127 family)
LSIVLSLTCNACKKDSQNIVSPIKIEFKKEGELTVYKSDSDSIKAKFNIEIADDDYQRQTGLMHHRQLGNDQGMLFIFDDENFRSFYMKNTYIALDIIYLDKEGSIVHIIYDTKPLDETSLPSNEPAQYVLEINAGLAQTFDLQINDEIKYQILEE